MAHISPHDRFYIKWLGYDDIGAFNFHGCLSARCSHGAKTDYCFWSLLFEVFDQAGQSSDFFQLRAMKPDQINRGHRQQPPGKFLSDCISKIRMFAYRQAEGQDDYGSHKAADKNH